MTTRPARRLHRHAALLLSLAAAACGENPATRVATDRVEWAMGPCGDGVIDVGEQCDDGNARAGDGCSGTCQVEPQYTCATASASAMPGVANGGFDAQGAITGATGTQISGWTVAAGAVDLVVNGEPLQTWLQPAQGTGMVDLAGGAAGAIQQALTTVAGRVYTVHFSYAARCPGLTPCTRTFRVEAFDPGTSTTLTTQRFTGAGDPQPVWRSTSVAFTATGTSTALRFTSTDADTANGALVDAVSVPASSCALVPTLSCLTPQTALSDLSLNGHAVIQPGSILATTADGNQLGAAFSTRTFAPSSFSAVARLRTATPSDPPADGFALVFQNDPRGPAALGCYGEALGYGDHPDVPCTNGIRPSVAVEVDTYFNDAWDTGTTVPHIAIDANGSVAHLSPAVNPTFAVVNATFTIWVDYDAPSRQLQVFGSAGTAKPAAPLLVHTLTPAQAAVFDSPFYAGITGSTGGFWESQEIIFYSISNDGILDANGDGLDDRCNVCGNGYVDQTTEQCDDGNASGGDGCGATCQVETGYTCTGLPSSCIARTGDGLVRGGERCDDGNTTDADGCSAMGEVEAGWLCLAPAAVDTTVTVDGATACAAAGSATTVNPQALAAGRYLLSYESGSVRTTGGATYRAAAEVRASVTGGASWVSTASAPAQADQASATAAVDAAAGSRIAFATDGTGASHVFFPDASCGDNSGTTTWRLRALSSCAQVPDTGITSGPAPLSNASPAVFALSSTVPGATFECSLDGAAWAACTSPASFAGLAQGDHTLAVRTVNGAAVDATPATWAWTLDTAVATPALAYPAAGAQTAENPTIAGTGEPGATVTVREDGVPVCTAAVDAYGSWSCTSALGGGTHTVAATQTDAAGNVSAASASRTFTVIVGLPAVALGPQPPIDSLHAAAYAVGGSCTAADGAVTIAVGAVAASAACTSGAFAVIVDASGVPDAAAVPVTASQTNGFGTATDGRLVAKDTAVSAPAFTAPAEGALVSPGPTVTGTAEPGASVAVREGAVTLCAVTARASGGWTCATALGAGPHTLTATQTDPAGNPSPAASRGFTVVGVPVLTVGAPAAITAANAAGYGVTGTCDANAGDVTVSVGDVTGSTACSGGSFSLQLDVSAVRDGAAVAVAASQTSAAGTGAASRTTVKDTVAAAAAIASPAEGGQASASPTLSGATEPGATVTVQEGGATVCTAVADALGNWSCPTSLGAGAHTLTSSMVDAVGNASPAVTRSFTVIGPPAVSLAALPTIADANDAAYVVSGACTDASGTVFVSVTGSATVTGSAACSGGTFSVTLDVRSLDDAAAVTVTASQTNAAGTTTDSAVVRMDTAVATPAISTPASNSTVPLSPTVTGTGEPGATVTVTEGGVTRCTALVDAGGGWWCSTTLGAGGHTIRARQTDAAGNVSGLTGNRFFTCSAALPDVKLNTPALITAANAAAYAVSGTCTSTFTVTVTVGTVSGTTACSGGLFSRSLNVSGLADAGSVTVTASQTNGANTGTDTKTTRKDTTAAAPAVAAPAAGAEVAASFTASGTAEAGATVWIAEGVTTVCTTTANAGGAWSCPATLAVGGHSITATQRDAAGNTSAASAARTFTVVGPPVVAVAAPAVINAANASGYSVGGTCTASTSVTVTVGSVIATAPCSGGTFTASSMNVSSIADGPSVEVSAAQTNAAGTGVDSRSTPKDTVVAAPSITAPAAAAETAGTPTVSGTGETGASVTVREGGTTLCTAIVAGGGTWSCASSALPPGSHTVAATQTDAAGNVSGASAGRTFTVVAVPAVTLTAPALISSASAAAYPVSGTCTGSYTVTVSVGGVGGTTPCAASAFSTSLDVTGLPDAASVTVTASQTSAAGPGTASASTRKDTASSPPIVTSPAAGGEAAANPTVSGAAGAAEAGATVTVKEGAATLCTATADGAGAWSCATTLAAGAHTLSATQTDTAGNASAATVRSFTVVTLPVVSLAAPAAINAANAASYPVSGTCTSTYSVSVSVGTASGTTACSGGAFSTALDVTAVADAASVAIAASQSNAAGTGSASGSASKDTVANPPTVTSPAAGGEAGVNPTVSGTAEAGATVTVAEGAATLCTATADGSGAWSCAATLGVGAHTLSVTQTDPAGNTSAATLRSFTVVLPPIVSLAVPAAIDAESAGSYSVSGSCTSPYSVAISVGGVAATAPCDGGGFTASGLDVTALPDAEDVAVSASQTNGAGTANDATTVLKDTVAAPPVILAPAPAAEVALNPTVSGTAEPGAAIALAEGGLPVGAATADPAGAWSCATTLAAGLHTLDAVQTDGVGNVSAAASVTFTVAPVPVVTLDPLAVVSSGNAAAFPVAGGCTGTSAVDVAVGAVSGSASCSGGRWSATLDLHLLADAASLGVTASQTTVSGTGSASGVTAKDTVAAPPSVASPPEASETGPNPPVSGTAEAGAAVAVTEGGTPVCGATADGAGAWSCATTLAAGAHTLSVTQTDAAGNASAATLRSFTVVALPVVSLAAPAAIDAESAGSYTVSGTCTSPYPVSVSVGSVGAAAPCTGGAFTTSGLDVTAVPDAASVTVSASQTNGAGTASDSAPVVKDTVVAPPAILAPASGAEVAPNPTASGTAEPGAAIALTAGGLPVGAATANPAGAWSCATTLAAGLHTLDAVQTDGVGNVSAAASVTFSVAPVPVVTIDPLAVVSSGNAAAFPVAGGCTGAYAVDVAVDAVAGSTGCSGGRWATTLDLRTLPDAATLPVTASQTNVAGTGSASRVTAKDTVAAPPVIASPLAAAQVGPHPTVSGTAEAGATVAVTEGGAPVCSASADGAGNWSCTTTLGAGAHTLSAVQTDAAGNASAAAGRAFTVVDAPAVVLDALLVVNAARAAAYPVSGACDAAAGAVTVTAGGVTATTGCAAGSFGATLDLSAVADAASLPVSASQTNAAGTGVDARTVLKDTVANPPAVDSPAEGATVAASPTVSGHAEPDAAVTVTEGAAPVCGATADALGQWSCTTTLGLGAHTLTAVQTDAAGNASAAATRSFTVTGTPAVSVDALAAVNAARASSFPVTGACTGAAGSVTVSAAGVVDVVPCVGAAYSAHLDLSGVADGPITVTAAQTNVAGTGSAEGATVKDTLVLAPAILSPAEGGLAAAAPTLSGTAEASATVTVTEGATPVCVAVASPLGAWSCATTLGLGPHGVSATQTDVAGNASAAATASFTVVGVPAVAIDDPAPVAAANAGAYPVTGQCDALAGAVTISVGSASATAPCNAGAFGATLDVSAVPDAATVAVTASQTDVAGTGSASRSTAKDTVALPPAIVSPASGATLATRTPTVSGTAEPGATVTFDVDGGTSVSVTADAGGAWSLAVASALADGAHTVHARQRDTFGNGSATASSGFTVSIALAVDGPTAGAVVDSDRPLEIRGVASPGESVDVLVDGVVVGTAVADGSGSWTYTLPPHTLPAGPHTVAVRPSAGGAASPAVAITVREPAVRLAGGGCGCGAGAVADPSLLVLLGLLLGLRRRRG